MVAIGEGFMSDSVCEMTTDTHTAMQSCHFSFFAPSGVVADRTASASVLGSDMFRRHVVVSPERSIAYRLPLSRREETMMSRS